MYQIIQFVCMVFTKRVFLCYNAENLCLNHPHRERYATLSKLHCDLEHVIGNRDISIYCIPAPQSRRSIQDEYVLVTFFLCDFLMCMYFEILRQLNKSLPLMPGCHVLMQNTICKQLRGWVFFQMLKRSSSRVFRNIRFLSICSMQEHFKNVCLMSI